MKFVEELGIKLEHKEPERCTTSFARELSYNFNHNNYVYTLTVSRLDELLIVRMKRDGDKYVDRDRYYCIFTDKTNQILRKYLSENSSYIESEEELIPEFECNGISLDEWKINDDEIKNDIVHYCELIDQKRNLNNKND